MTENDYIAEYIKEKHPGLLGVDFAACKLGKIISEAASSIVKFFNEVDMNEPMEKIDEGN